MYLNVAIKTMEMNIRSLCMMLEVVRKEQLNKVVADDWLPMQDHFAECVPAFRIHENSSVDSCLEYLKELYKGMKQALKHYELACEKDLILEPDVIQIVDMFWGFIGHPFLDNYVACARECYGAYMKMLPDPKEEKNDENQLKWARKVMAAFEPIIKKHDVKLDFDGEWTLNEGYLMEWLRRKYDEMK